MTQSSQPTPIGTLATITDEALMNMAKKWHLVDDAGNVWCMKGCREPATAPTLECETCKARRRHQSAPRNWGGRGFRRSGTE
jgi:hypothetical protein